MKRAVILHGTGGSPESNWFRWLESELKRRGLAVWLPQLPNTQRPSLREGADFVHAKAPFTLDEDTLLIGHSSGAILALILAQESSAQLGAVTAVSVFHNDAATGDDSRLGNLPHSYAAVEWDANSMLFDVPFNYSLIRQNARRLLFVHSDDDPYVPLQQAQYVADSCGAAMVIIHGQGHFNLEQSLEYARFPKLVELLEARGMV